MTRSMGVALISCTVPAVGRPTFELGDDEMEMGVGIHGESGRRRVPLRTANAIAEELVQAITDDLHAKAGSETLLLVNGFGGTPRRSFISCTTPPSGRSQNRGSR
jgi:dihydroxyacetone kinase-like protein